MNRLSFASVSLDVLDEVAKDIVAALNGRTIILFYGEMGSGKTTLIKEICKQLGVTDSMSSPTYAIVNEYHTNPPLTPPRTGRQNPNLQQERKSTPCPSQEGNKKIFHFDLYRVKNLEECLDIAMEEYLYSGNYCFIEWPDMAASLYPENVVKVFIEGSGELRSVSLSY